MPLYEEKFISPFAIRFSQARIRPTFQDGRVVERTMEQIEDAAFPGDPSDSYDIVLDAPFPPIEIIRFRAKLRDDDGVVMERQDGSIVLGDECWFTFDNRRLYCLQAAAVRRWPRRTACVVHVMHDLPCSKGAPKKFRTTDMGCSVVISRRHDAVPQSVWTWLEVAVGDQPHTEDTRIALDRVAIDAALNDCSDLLEVPDESLWRRSVPTPSEQNRQLQVGKHLPPQAYSGGQRQSPAYDNRPNYDNRSNYDSRSTYDNGYDRSKGDRYNAGGNDRYGAANGGPNDRYAAAGNGDGYGKGSSNADWYGYSGKGDWNGNGYDKPGAGGGGYGNPGGGDGYGNQSANAERYGTKPASGAGNHGGIATSQAAVSPRPAAVGLASASHQPVQHGSRQTPVEKQRQGRAQGSSPAADPWASQGGAQLLARSLNGLRGPAPSASKARPTGDVEAEAMALSLLQQEGLGFGFGPLGLGLGNAQPMQETSSAEAGRPEWPSVVAPNTEEMPIPRMFMTGLQGSKTAPGPKFDLLEPSASGLPPQGAPGADDDDADCGQQ